MRKKLKVKLMNGFNQELNYSKLLLNGANIKGSRHVYTEAVTIYYIHGQLMRKFM
jgi:hypothetical protein